MNTRFQSNCFALADFFSFYLSFAFGLGVLSFWAGFSSERDFATWFATTGIFHLLTFTIFVLCAVGRFISIGAYQKRMLYWDELPSVFQTVFIFALLHGVTVFIFRSPLSRSLWLASWFFSPWFILFFRGLTRRLLRHGGHWQIKIVCLGKDALSDLFLKLTETEPSLGFDVIETIPWPDDPVSFESADQFFKQKIRELRPDLTLVASQNPSALRLFQSLSRQSSHIHLVPPLQGMPLLSLQTQFFFSHEIFLLSPKPDWVQQSEFRWKRWFDIAGSLVLMVLLSPIFLGLALVMLIFEPGHRFSFAKSATDSGENFLTVTNFVRWCRMPKKNYMPCLSLIPKRAANGRKKQKFQMIRG